MMSCTCLRVVMRGSWRFLCVVTGDVSEGDSEESGCLYGTWGGVWCCLRDVFGGVLGLNFGCLGFAFIGIY